MENLNVILFLAGFVRTLVVVIVIYYLIKLISRFVLPLFINQPNQRNNFRQQRPTRKEGDVTIEGDRPRSGQFSKDEGEYVDFEEVD